MPEQLYRVIFLGKIAPGQKLDEVKRKFAELYKQDVATIERLIFIGKPVVIKSHLDQQTALHLQAILSTRTGGLFEVDALPLQQRQKSPESRPLRPISPPHTPPQPKQSASPREVRATRPRTEAQPLPQDKHPSFSREVVVAQPPAEAKGIKVPKHPTLSAGVMICAADRIGFWPRLGASLLDLILMLIISFLVGTFLGGLVGGVLMRLGGGIEQIGEFEFLGALLGGFISFLVSFILVGDIYNLIEGFSGASPAKMLLGFKIANADGTKASIVKLLLRYGFKNIIYITSIVAGLVDIRLIATIGAGVGLVWFLGCFAALGKQKQALHDMLLKTAVYPRNVFRKTSTQYP